MQHDEIKRDLRAARFALWWDKWDVMVYLAGMAFAGMLIGGYVTSVYDRTERMQMMRRHDDDIRDMRMQCRRVVDDRDEKIKGALETAATALKSEEKAAEEADQEQAKPAPKKASPRRAPPDINEAVRKANREIAGKP